MDDMFKSIKNVDTAIKLAIYLEEKGAEYYRHIADRADDNALKQLFSFLADEEQKHYDLFQTLLKKSGQEPFQSDELFGEYGMFVELLASDLLKSLVLNTDMGMGEAIAGALQFEKDTLIVFNELLILLPDDATDALVEICEEERRHIIKLLEYKKNYD